MLPFVVGAALPALRWLDPERAHGLAIKAIGSGWLGRWVPGEDARLRVAALGQTFPNPIGLAAGFDKNAAAVSGLMRLGFGFVETGSVTPRPQPGNPRPRLFRLAEDGAVINRLGFNNAGLEAYLANLRRLNERPVPLGANVGINKDGADPVRDYPALIGAVRGLADYAVINVSSPNTPHLRDLQSEDRLRAILQAVATVANRPPILVKIAPDLSPDGLQALVETCVANGVAGLIVGNTTIARPADLRSRHARQGGGLSGRPLWALSTTVLARAALAARGRLLLVGTGGIFTGADVLTKIEAGASLVQVYTSFIYAGPALVPRLQRELLAALRDRGYADVGAAVGARANQLAEHA